MSLLTPVTPMRRKHRITRRLSLLFALNCNVKVHHSNTLTIISCACVNMPFLSSTTQKRFVVKTRKDVRKYERYVRGLWSKDTLAASITQLDSRCLMFGSEVKLWGGKCQENSYSVRIAAFSLPWIIYVSALCFCCLFWGIASLKMCFCYSSFGNLVWTMCLSVIFWLLVFSVLQVAHVGGQGDGGHEGCVPGFQVKKYQVMYRGPFQKGQRLLQGQ